MKLLHRIWLWLCAIFTKQNVLCENMPDHKVNDKKRNKKHRGKLIWDSAHGTYRRHMYEPGRNQPCPCGVMRQVPRDTTKRMKFKYCCGKAW